MSDIIMVTPATITLASQSQCLACSGFSLYVLLPHCKSLLDARLIAIIAQFFSHYQSNLLYYSQQCQGDMQ